MKLSPKAVQEAAQIGRLLLSTANSAAKTSDANRRAAGDWWVKQLERLRNLFKQQER